MNIGEDVRKVMMAGIGALSAIAEKTHETIESLAQKGEEALSRGQVLNERMRHKIQQAFRGGDAARTPDKDDILKALDSLKPEDLKAVKEKLRGMGTDGE